MHRTLKTAILPSKHIFAKTKQVEALNLEAICLFVATGFFMDDDTYWKNKICLKPGYEYTLDLDGFVINSIRWFNWHYNPEYKNFDEVLDEYITLLKGIMHQQLKESPVILPLSGGLDSRSQALVLKTMNLDVQAFSYEFTNGYSETKIASAIAKNCGFNFNSYKIESGYLWNEIEDLFAITKGYSEFTHPRQMAVLNKLKQYQGIFTLGHWGDVFFDKGAPSNLKDNEIVSYLIKKMVKPSGLELAEALWQAWQLEGDFKEYLVARTESALNTIQIDSISAKVRAFKTTQWAHRWTTTNLSVFEAAHPITMPYYDDAMCEFICTVPEDYLADRRLQLAHIKRDKTLANIIWQAQAPYTINNYSRNRIPYNLPNKVLGKSKRTLNNWFGKPYIQRNWELQFLGKSNETKLESYLFSNPFNTFVPKDIVTYFYDQFQNKNPVQYSHSISMLLTLAMWYVKKPNN